MAAYDVLIDIVSREFSVPGVPEFVSPEFAAVVDHLFRRFSRPFTLPSFWVG